MVPDTGAASTDALAQSWGLDDTPATTTDGRFTG